MMPGLALQLLHDQRMLQIHRQVDDARVMCDSLTAVCAAILFQELASSGAVLVRRLSVQTL